MLSNLLFTPLVLLAGFNWHIDALPIVTKNARNLRFSAASDTCDPEKGPESGRKITSKDGKTMFEACPVGLCTVTKECKYKTEFEDLGGGMCCEKICNYVLKSDDKKPCAITKDQCDVKEGPEFNCNMAFGCGCMMGEHVVTTYEFSGEGSRQSNSCCSKCHCEADPVGSCDPKEGPAFGMCQMINAMRTPPPSQCELEPISYEFDKDARSCCEKSPRDFVKKDGGGPCKVTADECDEVDGPEFDCGYKLDFACLDHCKKVPGKFKYKRGACCRGPGECVCEKMPSVGGPDKHGCTPSLPPPYGTNWDDTLKKCVSTSKPATCDPKTGLSGGHGRPNSCPMARCDVPMDCDTVTEYETTADGSCCQKVCNFKKKDGSECKITADECDAETGPAWNCKKLTYATVCMDGQTMVPGKYSFSEGVHGECCKGPDSCEGSATKLKAMTATAKVAKVHAVSAPVAVGGHSANVGGSDSLPPQN